MTREEKIDALCGTLQYQRYEKYVQRLQEEIAYFLQIKIDKRTWKAFLNTYYLAVEKLENSRVGQRRKHLSQLPARALGEISACTIFGPDYMPTGEDYFVVLNNAYFLAHAYTRGIK